MEEESEVRQRKPPQAVWTKIDDPSSPAAKQKKPSTEGQLDDEDAINPWLDMFRILVGLLIVYCGLSYLMTGGETFSMGYQVPVKYLQLDAVKSYFHSSATAATTAATIINTEANHVGTPPPPATTRAATTKQIPQQRKPIIFTPEELAMYDGTDETKPIYLAINGTIYDVSSNRRTYGPGGSYQYFAGVDASRAYVTGCFAEDRTADMRGVEEMFLPLEDPEFDSKHWTPQELSELRKKEREEAREKVHDSLKHWVEFFRKSKKYRNVGRVKREKGWLKKEKRRKLCQPAQDQRVRRKAPTGK